MHKSKVYFTDMRVHPGTNLQEKLRKLIIKAGVNSVDFNEKFTAIKIHFGEPGNLSFLRPNFAKTVADYIKEQGGVPFLTDCNTLYVGRRKNAIDHIDAAYENGFTPFSTGCHVIIADGLKGTDEVLVPVEGGTYVKRQKSVTQLWMPISFFHSIILKVMSLPVLAVQLKIWVWDVLPGQERWSSITMVSHRSIKASAKAVKFVPKIVRMELFRLGQTKRHRLTIVNVSVAVDVSVPALLMQFQTKVEVLRKNLA